MGDKMRYLTQQDFDAALTDGGGYNRTQLEAIGVKWPLTHGWRRKAMQTQHDEKDIARFIALRTESRPRLTFNDLKVIHGVLIDAHTVLYAAACGESDSRVFMAMCDKLEAASKMFHEKRTRKTPKRPKT